MNFRTSIISVAMIFIVSPTIAEDLFSVAVKLASDKVSLSDLPSFKYGGNSGYYFTIKVSVTNRTSSKRMFMVDDDCTFASWKIEGQNVEILSESCLKNIYEDISLNPGEAYSSTVKIWFPESYLEDEIGFLVGFVEIVDYKEVSGPYWSDFISVDIRK